MASMKHYTTLKPREDIVPLSLEGTEAGSPTCSDPQVRADEDDSLGALFSEEATTTRTEDGGPIDGAPDVRDNKERDNELHHILNIGECHGLGCQVGRIV